MPDRATEPAERTEPADRTESTEPTDEDTADNSPSEAEQARRQDPDAPALGAVDDGDQPTDLPEPQEPG